jgi:hypothetical protein
MVKLADSDLKRFNSTMSGSATGTRFFESRRLIWDYRRSEAGDCILPYLRMVWLVRSHGQIAVSHRLLDHILKTTIHYFRRRSL